MPVSKRISCISKECVACGACVKVCRLNAISVYKGLYAEIDGDKCVGCGKCANECPALVISLVIREEARNEEVV